MDRGTAAVVGTDGGPRTRVRVAGDARAGPKRAVPAVGRGGRCTRWAVVGQETLRQSRQPVVSKYSPLLTVTRVMPVMLPLAMIPVSSPEASFWRDQ